MYLLEWCRLLRRKINHFVSISNQSGYGNTFRGNNNSHNVFVGTNWHLDVNRRRETALYGILSDVCLYVCVPGVSARWMRSRRRRSIEEQAEIWVIIEKNITGSSIENWHLFCYYYYHQIHSKTINYRKQAMRGRCSDLEIVLQSRLRSHWSSNESNKKWFYVECIEGNVIKNKKKKKKEKVGLILRQTENIWF